MKLPPRFRAGSRAFTGKEALLGGMVNMGLKKSSGLRPQMPSWKGAQGLPPTAQTLMPLGEAELATKAGAAALVAVAR